MALNAQGNILQDADMIESLSIHMAQLAGTMVPVSMAQETLIIVRSKFLKGQDPITTKLSSDSRA